MITLSFFHSKRLKFSKIYTYSNLLIYACLPPSHAFKQTTDILFLCAVVCILGFDRSLLGLIGAVVTSAFDIELFGKCHPIEII